MRFLAAIFLSLVSIGFISAIFGVAAVAMLIGYYSQDLPDYNQLKDYRPPVISRVYAGDGRLLTEFAEEKRVFIPIHEIPDLVKQAFIAAEDQNFYTHPGVDYTAIARAVLSNIKSAGSGRRPVGASTITQQVAKNFLLTNEVSIERKIKEAILSMRMEKALSKDRLLELYLNEIFLGNRSYGVGAAALNYFNKSLNELTIAEAAYLAALPKAPNNYHPVRHKDAAVDRRNWVINRMYEDGYIPADEARKATMFPLVTAARSQESQIYAPYFADEIKREIGKRFGEESLLGEGFSVRSTLDPAMQAVAEKTLREGLMSYDRRRGWRGAISQAATGASGWKGALEAIPEPQGKLPAWQ
ncbi:MAG: penicillin-binding protein, partial [Alphaproteobacteria bacterium]|nr:penicillin-binding protein [Alphaproteobacteria bacterium]